VTLAVHLLGGRDRYVDTEDVAMKTHELAPGRFSWRKYPDQINLELVRVRLSEAKSAKHGAMLRGSGTRGWTLTAKGLKWASQIAGDPTNLHTQIGQERERGGSVDAQRIDRERARLLATPAWTKWSSDRDQISARDAQEVFRLDSYATDDLRLSKVDRLRKIFINDAATLEFLAYLDELLLRHKG
jgi:hypothetical protein